MPNNFRIITGIDVYTSKDGSDANPVAADPNAPKLTLADQGVVDNAVGNGEYKGAFSLNPGITTRKYYADRICKILCTADLIFPSGNGNTDTSFNEGVVGGYWKIDLNGSSLNMNRGKTRFTRGEISNGFFVSNVQHEFFATDTVIENIQSTGNCNIDFRFNNCSLFNFNVSITAYDNTVSELIDSYMGNGSNLGIPTYFNTPATQFKNCNIQGIITVGGTPYELKQEKDGTPINPNPGIADIATIDAGVYTRGNFSQNPEYFALSKKNFKAVQLTSPNLGAGSDGLSNIGNVRGSVWRDTGDIEFSSPDTLQDLILSTGDYIYDVGSGSGFGFVLSDPILFNITPDVEMGEENLAQLFNYNSLQLIGGAENNNVPSVDNYGTGTAGANPRRFTYLLRFSTAGTVPTVAGDYDNNGYAAAGSFFKMEHLNNPQVDVTGLGNGETQTPNIFNPSGAVGIAPTYYQVGIYLQEGIG